MSENRVTFDPLSYANLGLSIVNALERQPVESLVEVERFDGAGIYALYYTGDYPAYRSLSEVNRQSPGCMPIYIGKAEAESSRKGLAIADPKAIGPKLFTRICNHKRSISESDNLEAKDFSVRLLVVTPTWVPLAEQIAIRTNQPLWNTEIDGLGNHDPGSGRRGSMRSKWDTLHPGRNWASKLQPNKQTVEEIAETAYSKIEHRLIQLNRDND